VPRALGRCLNRKSITSNNATADLFLFLSLVVVGCPSICDASRQSAWAYSHRSVCRHTLEIAIFRECCVVFFHLSRGRNALFSIRILDKTVRLLEYQSHKYCNVCQAFLNHLRSGMILDLCKLRNFINVTLRAQ